MHIFAFSLHKYTENNLSINQNFMVSIRTANEDDVKYIYEISNLIEKAAKKRGTGIAKRTPEYIKEKILDGKAVIASNDDGLVGFCYIESWEGKKFVATSGLIVKEEYRGQGISRKIKQKAFELSRSKFPQAKLFSITTSIAVLKLNLEMGYKPVTLSELTDDDAFWKGCETCVNYPILQHTNRTHCLCTGLLYDPNEVERKEEPKKTLRVYARWFKYKMDILSKYLTIKNKK